MSAPAQLKAAAVASGTPPFWTDRSWFYEARAATAVEPKAGFYHQLLRKYYSLLVPPGLKTLEVGCGAGDLLAAVRPGHGVGIDFSAKAVAVARRKHPDLDFHIGDAATFALAEQFDYILMADIINDLPDVQAVFENLRRNAHSNTRLVLNFFNHLWHPVIVLAENLGIKSRSLPQNWLSSDDVTNLLHLAGWEVIKTERRILLPIDLPLIAPLFNRFLAPLLAHCCLTVLMVARPRPERPERHYTCSIIIPARNEAGNIEGAVRRTPELGVGTELIFVEGHSRDDTWEEIQRVIKKYPDRNIKAFKQQTHGKGAAVREAFASATGELLFILDADLTVPPEELPKFYEILRSGTADFVNGVRLVYPMQHEAMRFLNMMANKLFGLAFSWLLGQKIKDTLCGTKAFFRADYEMIARNRAYFGDFDPFGDFDLLFGAAKLNLRILDLPIRYRARTYGETNIHRWQHGWLLLRMVLFAARSLKFI